MAGPPSPRARRAAALRGLAVDVTPLRVSRDFRLLFGGFLVSLIGRQVTVVAVPYQVYTQTHSAFAVGMIGLVQVVPLIGVSLLGGPLADRYDRRRILMVTEVLLAGCSVVLAVGAFSGGMPLWALYTVVGVAAGFSAVDQPARSATIPNLVPRTLLSSAIALNFTLFQISLVVGPAIGGLVLARFGLGPAYTIDAATYGAALLAAVLISPQPPHGAIREAPLRAVRRGLEFAWRERVILSTFAIDLDAMIFGMPKALFPVLAATRFHTGPGGLGLLYAAPGAGAILAALTTGWVARVRHQGRAIVIAVAAWGVGILGFGLSTTLVLALVCLAAAGAADSYSAVCRSTITQVITPDALRGRVSAVFSMVVVGGSQLGDVEAGSVAAVAGAEFSVLSGAAACIVGVGVCALAFPQLWDYDARAVPVAETSPDLARGAV